jgi:hypothetical protein
MWNGRNFLTLVRYFVTNFTSISEDSPDDNVARGSSRCSERVTGYCSSRLGVVHEEVGGSPLIDGRDYCELWRRDNDLMGFCHALIGASFSQLESSLRHFFRK